MHASIPHNINQLLPYSGFYCFGQQWFNILLVRQLSNGSTYRQQYISHDVHVLYYHWLHYFFSGDTRGISCGCFDRLGVSVPTLSPAHMFHPFILSGFIYLAVINCHEGCLVSVDIYLFLLYLLTGLRRNQSRTANKEKI